MNPELSRRCSGFYGNREGNYVLECPECLHAIKCRLIVHHIQHMKAKKYNNNDIRELLELFMTEYNTIYLKSLMNMTH